MRWTSVSLIVVVIALLGVVVLSYWRWRRATVSNDPHHGQAGMASSPPFVFSPKLLVSEPLENEGSPAEKITIDGELNDPAWSSAGKTDDLVTLKSLERPSAKTELLVTHDTDAIYFGFRCQVAPGKKAPASEQDGQQQERIDVYFSPTNDHTRYMRVQLAPAGDARVFAGYLLRGELPADRMAGEKEIEPSSPLRYATSQQETHWQAEVAIPRSLLSGAAASTETSVGFNVVRRMPLSATSVAWACAAEQSDVAPVEFGRLSLAQPVATVTSIDFGQPTWGANHVTMTLRNNTDQELSLKLRSQVFLPIEDAVIDEAEVPVTIPANQEAEATVPFTLSWRGRWPMQVENFQRVFLSAETDNARIYATSFPVSHNYGLIAEETYGRDSNASNPAPNDKDFLARKRDYILGRLPSFSRRMSKTNSGYEIALTADDGSIEFDLMQPGVMQRIADWLHGQYDTDIDRMLGAMFFVHQRNVTRNSKIHQALNPLSILRSGGGWNDDRAWVLADIISRMKDEETGKPLRARCLSTKGHIATAVESIPSPQDVGDHYVLDPDMGVFYFSADNTRLATLREMRENQELSKRAHFNHRRHDREFYFRNDKINVYDGERSRLWPAGTPAE